jgi:hypothetical protein
MSEQQSSADSDLLNRLRIFVKSESTDWFNLGTRKLEFTQVTAAGNLVQEVIDFLTVRAEPQSLPTREEIAKAIGVALYGEDAFRSPDLNGWNLSAVLPAADATIALFARSQAVIASPLLSQLSATLEVMKSANSREPDRLMSVWSRDIEAVEAAVAALTRPVCTCGGDPDQPAAQHDLTCPATLTSHQRNRGDTQ